MKFTFLILSMATFTFLVSSKNVHAFSDDDDYERPIITSSSPIVISGSTETVLVGNPTIFGTSQQFSSNNGVTSKALMIASVTAVAGWGYVYGRNSISNNMKFIIADSTGGVQCISTERSIGTSDSWNKFYLGGCNYTINSGTLYALYYISAGFFTGYGNGDTGSPFQTTLDATGTEASPPNPLKVQSGDAGLKSPHSIYIIQ